MGKDDNVLKDSRTLQLFIPDNSLFIHFPRIFNYRDMCVCVLFLAC